MSTEVLGAEEVDQERDIADEGCGRRRGGHPVRLTICAVSGGAGRRRRAGEAVVNGMDHAECDEHRDVEAVVEGETEAGHDRRLVDPTLEEAEYQRGVSDDAQRERDGLKR